MATKINIEEHPCFNIAMMHVNARVHLPVAPKCNIQCNYCNRKYDCINESRPGVTSSILTPYQAVKYLSALNDQIDNLKVVGIAGPGDPFANPNETIETIRQVHDAFPDKIFCLSTNGLEIEPYIDEIANLGVTHVTITINAVDPKIGSKIYKWMRINKHVYRGEEGARILMNQQLAAVSKLHAKRIIVKINSIIVPGINDEHIQEVAIKCKELGADVINCIPMLPTADTPFGTLEEPSKAMVFKTRLLASEHIPLVSHCVRCRADAAGLLGHDLKESYALLREFASRPDRDVSDRPYVAVATNEGLLVNLHLGEADSLYIFKQSSKGYKFVEQRRTPTVGLGDQRWIDLASILNDCQAVLVSGVGDNPRVIFENCGIHVIQMTGLIDEGLEGIYEHRPIRSISKQEVMGCHGKCSGNREGCA
jgi:nitrogen fixation protein NifB